MKRHFVRLLVAFAAFSLGLVLTSFKTPTFEYHRVVAIRRVQPQLTTLELTEDEAQIRQVYREYGPAQTRHDRRFFERIETEDFTLTVGDLRMSRKEDIKWMEDQPTNLVYEVRVDHLKIFDQLAVSHGHLEIRDINGLVRQLPFADVWVKRDGTWRIQSTTSQ